MIFRFSITATSTVPNTPHYSDFLRTASVLAGSPSPSQSSLRRAASTVYYALFHFMCESVADCVVGREADFPKKAWRRAYRALNHGFAKNAVATDKGNPRPVLEKFPEAAQALANHFYAMQMKRHQADYDPFFELSRTDIQLDIRATGEIIGNFRALPEADRRAFVTLILFPDRKE